MAGTRTRLIPPRNTRERPASINRGHYRDEITAVFARAIFDLGLSKAGFARLIQRTEQRVGQMFSRTHSSTPTIAEVATWQSGEERVVAITLLRWAAFKLDVDIVERSEAVGDNHIDRLVRVDREACEARAVHGAAVADQHLSDAELCDAAREHREAADAHAREAAWFEARYAERRRVG